MEKGGSKTAADGDEQQGEAYDGVLSRFVKSTEVGQNDSHWLARLWRAGGGRCQMSLGHVAPRYQWLSGCARGRGRAKSGDGERAQTFHEGPQATHVEEKNEREREKKNGEKKGLEIDSLRRLRLRRRRRVAALSLSLSFASVAAGSQCRTHMGWVG
ncbi:hypothetical protein LY76DRAFT_242863 [Colletotrichum caudatum]|nr:hypothetical protein LY76DRAFT_242863 [Colletotrichum caudatum]